MATQNTPAAIGIGGTGQTTALAARASTGLNIDACTSTGDANYTILATDRCVYRTALTLPRTDTLPAANSVNAGQIFYFIDFRGLVTVTNTITIQRAGADTINGGTSVVALNAAFGAAIYWSDGVSRWTFFTLPAGGGSGTVNAGAGNIVPGSGSPATLFVEQMNPGGRLTLVSGVPVVTTDQAGITTIWYAPYSGRWVPVYDGTDMKLRNFTSSATDTVGLSIAMAGSASFPASTIFSTFIGLDSGTLRLCTVPWTNSGVGTSTRGTGVNTPELEIFNGIQTNKNSINCRYNGSTFFACAAHQCTYVGDLKTNASNGTIDVKGLSGSLGAGGVAGCICVYNAYNQVRGNAFIGDSTANWNYTLAAYRQADASAGNQIAVLQGTLGSIFSATNSTAALNSTTAGLVVSAGIGLDSTTVNSAQRQTLNQTQVAGLIVANEATLQVNLAAGLHNITRLESSGAAGVTTWVGNAGGVQTGMIADFWW